jgi:hypothetical protein
MCIPFLTRPYPLIKFVMRSTAFLISTCICILAGCTTRSSQKIIAANLIFPSALDTIIANPYPADSSVVYYFEGNCSVCYMTLKRLTRDFENLEIVGVTSSTDTALILYQFELIDINVTLLYDKDSLFYKMNRELFDFSNACLIDSSNTIMQILPDY